MVIVFIERGFASTTTILLTNWQQKKYENWQIQKFIKVQVFILKLHLNLCNIMCYLI